jgi:transposase
MSVSSVPIIRYIGLDVHKHYLVAYGVDRDQNPVYGPRRVDYIDLEAWVCRELRPTDAVALEMTTNTWRMVDLLEPCVHSVTVVHPPEVKAIVKARVMTDKKAARILAQLLAAGLLPAVWVPPQSVREIRSLVAGRRRMAALSTRAKNTLHAVLHAHHLLPPLEVKDIFHPKNRDWWESLPLSPVEMTRVLVELDTLDFAVRQKERYDAALGQLAAQEERVPLLTQLPGIGLIGAMTILGAVGVIERFPTAEKLVGYAGLGAQVHDSGQTRWTGRITKQGRRDLRRVLVDAAAHAVKMKGHWREVYERLKLRLGRPKALVAVARKLLVAVWHVLTRAVADRFATDEQVACSFFALAYKVGVRNLPEGVGARQYVRDQLDRLGLGDEVTHIPWGSKRFKLPPSREGEAGS